MRHPVWAHFQRNRTRYLFYSLILVVGFTSFMETNRVFFFVGNFLVGTIPLIGITTVQADRRHIVTSLLLGIPAIIVVMHGAFFGDGPFAGIQGAVIIAYYAVTTLLIIRYLVRIRRVTVEAIAGAASIYLLVGLTFALAYSYIGMHDPDAFSLGAGGGGQKFETALYFSFVTLTTLGYGDILPVAQSARTLAIFEATIGVMYLAIIIGRMVGLYQTAAEEDEV